MPIKDAKKRITEAVSSWGGITLTPHRFGGTAFMLGKRELGHIHGDRLVDIDHAIQLMRTSFELTTTRGKKEP
jgi:hypothetical protein